MRQSKPSFQLFSARLFLSEIHCFFFVFQFKKLFSSFLQASSFLSPFYASSGSFPSFIQSSSSDSSLSRLPLSCEQKASPASPARGTRQASSPLAVIQTLRKGKDDVVQLMQALGALFVAGVDVRRWKRVFDSVSASGRTALLRLPPTGLSGERHWVCFCSWVFCRSCSFRAFLSIPPFILFSFFVPR